VTWDGEDSVERFEATQCCEVKNRAWFSGLGRCYMEDNSLAAFKTALLTGIWLISKHVTMQPFRDE